MKKKILKAFCAAITAVSAAILTAVSAAATSESTLNPPVTTIEETTAVTDTESGAETSINSSSSAELTAEAVNVTAEETTSAVSTLAPPETTSGSESDTSETIPPNPFTTGVLADDSVYEYLYKFLNDPDNFTMSGTGMLVGVDELENGFSSEDGDNVDADKIMYTVTARDGSLYYIIIDKAAKGENVYFLNAVDYTDLAALIDTEKEKLSPAEKDILDKANVAVTTSTTTSPQGDESSTDTSEATTSASETQGGQSNSNSPTNSSPKNMTNYLYIGLGIVAVIIIGIAWYKKVGPGKQPKASFDEPEDEEYAVEDEHDDNYAEEDTESDEVGDNDSEDE